MRTATQEILAQTHEGSKVHDGIRSEVMELRSEKVQETSEKRMRGQGESAVDMSGDKDTLTLERLRLDLIPREAHRFVRDESPLSQFIEIFLTNRRRHPVALDPARGKADLEEDPPRLYFFTFACVVAFFARSRAAVFSFTIAAGEARTDRRHRDESRGGGGIREGRGKMKAHYSKTLGQRLIWSCL